jgi:hypothetical protein
MNWKTILKDDEGPPEAFGISEEKLLAFLEGASNETVDELFASLNMDGPLSARGLQTISELVNEVSFNSPETRSKKYRSARTQQVKDLVDEIQSRLDEITNELKRRETIGEEE